MNNTLKTLVSLAALLALSLGASSTFAQSGNAIGLMLSTSGTVTAQDEDGDTRRLVRRSQVFEGDTIITAARSRAQIRFNDNGLVALQPETSFYVEEHQFEGEEDGSESAIYSLLRGGLQAITGLIGRTNRDRYRVDTPLATIGLRGTHWTATLCTTACDGNPPGLYGGVADGGIDVCNGGGCTAVDTDTYFYAPDANTRPQLLLAPPSVVFADSSTDEEEEGDEAEETDETNGAAGGDEGNEVAEEGDGTPETEAPEDTSSFVASRADDVGTDTDLAREFGRTEELETEPVVSESQDAITRDTDDVIRDINPRRLSNPEIQLAGAGGVAAFASAFNEEGSPFSVSTVVIPGDNDDRIGLTNIVNVGNTLTALDFFDPEGGDCQPCLFALAPQAGQSAELQEYFSGTLGGANYAVGRWLGDATISESGSLLDALDNHHFAFADGLTPTLPGFDLPTVASYSLVDASLPVDGAGTTGTLNNVSLDVDFFEQAITAFDLSMTFGSREVSGGLSAPVSLAHPSRLVVAAREIELSGLCSGGVCGSQMMLYGSTSLAFIGSNAEGALGSFSLNDELNSSQSFAGAFVLGRDQTSTHPRYYGGTPAGAVAPTGAVGAFASSIISAPQNDDLGPGGISFAAFSDSGRQINQSINTTTLDGVEDVITGFHYEPGEYEEDEFGNPTQWEVVELGINDAFLVENGSTALGGSVPANWGLWLSPGGEDLQVSGDTGVIGPYLHYAYAESVTPLSYAPEPLSQLAYFSLKDGTSPTDLDGSLGTLNSVSLTLDYFQQAITQFDLSATIANATYLASNFGFEYLDGSWQDLELDLIGSCSGGSCGQGASLEGSSSLSFVGNTAQGALGHFSLATQDSSLGAYGVYLLEEQEVVSPHPFILQSPPQTTVAPSGSFASFTALDSFGEPGLLRITAGEPYSQGTLSGTESIQLATLGNVGNILAGFTTSRDDASFLYETSFAVTSGQLVEHGGISNFADTGQGVNWGRWEALASVTETSDGTNFSNLTVQPWQHYGYTSALGDIPEPGQLRTNPTVATYSWAGGTSPTDELGQAGVVDYFNLTADFYSQSLSSVELGLSIGDRFYQAGLGGHIDSYGYSRLNETGLSFAQIDQFNGYIPLIGQCEGGDCGLFDSVDPLGNETGGTYLEGAISLEPVGSSAQGLLGSYALIDSQAVGNCGFYDGPCETAISLAQELPISAIGTALLEQGTLRDHPRWVTNFSGTAATAGGTTLAATHVLGTDSYHPLTGLRSASGFNTMTVDGLPMVVSSVAATAGCTLCGVSLSDAVLMEYGADSHPYPYLSNAVETSWGTWRSRTANDWLNAEGSTVNSGNFFQFAYADSLTATMPDRPLTAFSGTTYYDFAGGTSPIDQSGNPGVVGYVSMDFNFDTQSITGFYASYDFFRDNDEDYYWYLSYSGTLPLSGTSAQIPLTGSCSNCGIAGSYAYLSAEGEARVAFAGDNAESAIGSLAGWSLADTTYAEGYYAMQHAFVLHQDFDGHWVINPDSQSASGALAIGSLIDYDGFYGFSFSGEIGQNGISAQLTDVFDEYSSTPHVHPSSVVGFSTNTSSFSGASGCSIGCSWDLLEGQVQWYDNNLNDASRTYDVYWGRWMHQDDVSIDGSTYGTNGYTQFAYSPDVTPLSALSDLQSASAVLTYGLTGSPRVANQSGFEGSLTSASMTVDFINQEVTAFALNASVNSDIYAASSLIPVALSGPSAEIGLDGTCSGACGTSTIVAGSANMTLIGPNAEGALGAFDLSTAGGAYGVSGAFVLDQALSP